MDQPWSPARAGLAELAAQLDPDPPTRPPELAAPTSGQSLHRWLAQHQVLSIASSGHTAATGRQFEARSLYVEQFWLPILGPTTLLAFRALQFGGATVAVPLTALAGALGVGSTASPSSTVVRSLARLVEFHLARPHGELLLVRSHAPELTARMRQRLPAHLAAIHGQALLELAQ